MAKTVDSCDHVEVADPGCVRAVLAELVLTFIFVFTGVAAAMAAGAPEVPGAAMPMAALAGVAIAQALAAGVLVTAGFHVSGGHLNPAVTVALLARGHITAFRSVLYIVAQLLASSFACILLRYLTGGMVTPVHALGSGIGPIQGLVMEAIFTFSLLFVVFATILDPRSSVPGFGPLLTGLIVGANTLAGGNFSGASMNPARSFGPALATGVWTNHWVYWLGPLIAAAASRNSGTMPGSIHVSVTQPPAIAPLFLQVALGNREYNGYIGQDEFAFPVTSLRESMVMLLYNGERILISQAELKTKAVVESGTVDAVFSLDNGGSIILRLQFLLSDEDRKRVQEMRNSAMKRKQQELLSDGSGLSQDSPSSKQPVEKYISNIPSKGDEPTLRKSMSLDGLQEKATRESPVQSVGRNSPRSEDPIDSKKLESRSSSAVKQMITAFQSSSSQGPNSLTRIRSERSLEGMPASSDNSTQNSDASSTPTASLDALVAGPSGKVQLPAGDKSFSSRSGKHHVLFSSKRSNASEGRRRKFSSRDSANRPSTRESDELNSAEMMITGQNRAKKRSPIGPCLLEHMHPHVCITTASRQLKDLLELEPTMDSNAFIGQVDIKSLDVQGGMEDQGTSDAKRKNAVVSARGDGFPVVDGWLINQGVRVVIVVIACGAIFLNNSR
ncbi:hypothetical protein ABZP36_012966 [Zizania latifolia]